MPRPRSTSALIATSTLALLATLTLVPSALAGDPPPHARVDPHYRAGLGLLERGQHAMALTELEAFLATGPAGDERANAEYARAICLIQLDRSDEARGALDAVLSAGPFAFRADTLLMRARIAFDAGEFADAAEFAGRIARESPDFGQCAFARQLAGESLLRAGRGAEALKELDALLATKPAPAIAGRAALLAAYAAANAHDDKGALERLALAPREGAERPAIDLLAAQCHHRLGDLKRAFASYAAAAESTPSDEALLGVGQTGRAIGERDRARAALDVLLAPGRSPSPGTRTSATIERARIALEEHDPARARALLEGIEPTDESADRLLSWRANAQAAQGDRAAAIATLEEALRRAPRSGLAPAMRFDLAALLLAEERWEAAATAYDRFLAGSPKHPRASEAAVRRAICLARLHRAEEARAAFSAALRTLPPEATAERELALAESLDLATVASDWSAVTALAESLLKTSTDGPRRAEAEFRLGIAAARTKRYADAVAALDRSLADAPKAPSAAHAQLERAEALLALDRADDAIRDLRGVIARAGDGDGDASLRDAARSRLANVLLQRGAADEATALLADAAGDALVDLAAAQAITGHHDAAAATLTRYLDGNRRAPRADEARARRGIALSRCGKADAALADLAAIADRPLPPDLAAAAAFERGLALASLHRDAEAIALFRELADRPSAYRAFAALESVRLAVEAGRDDEARQSLASCTAALGEAREAERPAIDERRLYFTGLLASRAGRHEEAVAAFTELNERFPKCSLSLQSNLLLGESLLNAGRAGDAAGAFERVIAAKPSDEILEPTLLRLGDACAAAQRWEASEAAYANHQRKYPAAALWPQARFGQGWAREQRGEFDAAIECYRDVVARHDGPTAARAQFQIGECLFAMRKLDDAVRELLKVDVLFAHAEWSAAALYEAGRCFVALGRSEDAARQFAAVRERFATTRWAELAAKDAAGLAAPTQPAPTSDSLPGHERRSGTRSAIGDAPPTT